MPASRATRYGMIPFYVTINKIRHRVILFSFSNDRTLVLGVDQSEEFTSALCDYRLHLRKLVAVIKTFLD